MWKSNSNATKWVLVRSTNTGKWMSIVLPLSCCRDNHRERAVNGRPLSPDTNALSHVQLPTAAAIDWRPTALQRPTDTRWCSKESNAYIHRHSTTLVHAHIYTHIYTHTRAYIQRAHTSSFLVSPPDKLPSQSLCSGSLLVARPTLASHLRSTA